MYHLLNALSWFLSRLSRRSLDRWARVLTFVTFSVLRLRRQLVLRNIATALGGELSPAAQKELARQSYYHFILTALEFLSARRGQLGAEVQVSGGEHMQAALAAGKGAYILCIHMGSWEAMGGAITRHFKPAHVIVKKVGPPPIDRFVNELRERNGFYSIRRQKKGDALLGIRRTLGKGEIVGFVMDQARPNEPLLPFFDQPAKTNTSFAAIWRRHPAPIVPAYIRRTGVGQHTLTFKPALTLACGPVVEDDITTHSTFFNKVVESMIRECPEQYFWLHNRWKY